MFKQVIFAVIIIYESGVVSDGANLSKRTRLSSILTSDGEDFKNFNDFLLPDGSFDLEKFMKLCDYSNLDEFYESVEFNELIYKRSYAQHRINTFKSNGRTIDIIDIIELKQEDIYNYILKHSPSLKGHPQTDQKMRERSKSLATAIAEKNMKKFIDCYLEIYDHVKLDRKRLLSFVEDESRLKEQRSTSTTTFGSIDRNDYNEIAYLSIKFNSQNPILRFRYIDSLKELDLSQKNITKLDKTIGYLRSLKKLNLEFNLITGVETETFNNLESLFYLSDLNLDANPMIILRDDGFKNLSKLTNLNVKYCSIYIMEENAFRGLNNLQNLYLHNNLIKKIESSTFLNLKRLVLLDLSSNELDSISFTFAVENVLEELNLAQNNFEILESNSLNNLKHLKILSFSDNLIDEIELGFFKGLSQLLELDLSKNELTEIESDTFEGLNNLNKLYLNDNYLKVINSNAINSLTSLSLFILRKNPIVNNTENFIELIRKVHFTNPKLKIGIDLLS